MILRSQNLAALLGVCALLAILSLFLFSATNVQAETMPSCPEGQTWSLNRCIEMAEATCQTGFTYVADNGCVQIPPDVAACPSGYVLEGGRCQLEGQACPVGQDWRDGSCQYRDEQGCPAGQERIDGSCVHITDTVCPVGYTWNDAQKRCQDNNEGGSRSGGGSNSGIAGLAFSRVSLYVVEGGTATYTVTLNTKPTTNVTVTIGNPTNTDVTVNPTVLTFTPDNWNVPQVVTVTASEDSDELDEEATITHTVSGDNDYGSVPNSGLTVNVVDNDPAAGITISDTDLTVLEGNSTRYTARLNSGPTADVTVTINDPTDNTDVTTGPDTLTFTSDNWYLPQTVTVSTQEDDDELHDEATVTHTVSGPTEYSGVGAENVYVTVHDDDGTPGVTISETSLTITEGGSEIYNVVLESQPTADVTVTVNDPTNTDVTASPTVLAFTPYDWDQPYTVSVNVGSDEDELHETATVTHSVSGAPEYRSVTAADVAIIVHDNDGTPGFTLSETSLTVNEGERVTYTIVLDAQPTGDVTVTINDPTDNSDVTTQPNSFTFTMNNWDQTQTVTVAAAQDSDDLHETATVTHTIGGAAEYTALTVLDVGVTVIDDESTAGVTISETSLTVAEGNDVTYTVVLTAQPSADVTVTIVDPTDNSDVTTNPTDLTFTSDTWDEAQTVTVSAAHDTDELHDTATVTHTIGGAVEYTPVTVPNVNVLVYDDDGTPGVKVSESSVTVLEGSTVTYTIVLEAQPTANVIVSIVDPTDNTDVTTQPTYVAFTMDTWDQAQTATVSAAHDTAPLDTAEDHETATVTHLVRDSSAAEYTSVTVDNVDVTVIDDDISPGVTFSETSLFVDEGESITYTAVLDVLPSADVTLTINDPTDNDEVTAEPATLTFTSANWDQPQTVTASAAEDTDKLHDWATVTHALSGATEYSSVSAANVHVTVHDDDGTPGVIVSTAFLTVPEGGSNTYTIVLNDQPTYAVFVLITDPTTAGTDVTVEPAVVVFNLANWNEPKTVTVSAREDTDRVHDSETVTHSIQKSISAEEYFTLTVASVAVTVTDNDIPDLTSQVQDGGDLTGSSTTSSTNVELDVSFSRPYTVYTYGELKWHSIRGAKETKVEAYWKVEATGIESTTVDSQTLWTDSNTEDSACITTTPDATRRTREFEQTVQLPAQPSTTETGSWQLRLRVKFDGVDAGACNAADPQVPATAIAESTWTSDLE